MSQGIYQIVNLVNQKRYIGSSINMGRRKNEHFGELRRNTHSNPYLQKAYNKHGRDKFIFEEMFHCDSEDELEQKELELYNSYDRKTLYNCKIPMSRFGGSLDNETKEKIRITLLKRPPFKGRKHSKESKKLMSVARKGKEHPRGKASHNYGMKHTNEARRKMSRKRRGKDNPNYGKHGKDNKLSKPVKQIDIQTGKVIFVFNSLAEAGEKIGVDSSNISRAANGKSKYSAGYFWEFI